MKKLLPLLLLTFSQVGFCDFFDTPLKVKWNCYLPTDVLNCNELKLGYMKKPLEEASNDNEMQLEIILRAQALTSETEYMFNMKGPLAKTPLSISLKLNANLSSAEKSQRVLNFMNQLTAPYLTIVNQGDSPSPSEVEKEKPYYLQPSVNGSGSKQQGSSSLNGSTSFTGNYSTKQWRLANESSIGMNISDVKRTAVAPGIKTNITYYGTNATIVRSLKDNSAQGKGQWDVALFIKDTQVKNKITIDGDASGFPEEALDNTAHKTSVRAGVEWIAVPFLTETSSGNIAVRYSLAGEHHKYLDPTSYQYIQETFAKHLLEVYLSKHYPKIDVSFGAGAFVSTFRPQQLKGLTGSSNVSYKINDRTILRASGSLQYAQNRVMSTAEGGTPSFLGLTSGNTPLTYNGSLTLTYTLGNIRLFNNEQRWK